MADEELDGQTVVEPDVPAEGADEPNNDVNDQKPDPIAELASEMGWVPKDQFRGDESEWRDAADFIRAGREISRSQSRELRGVREQLDRLGRTSAQIMADRLAERDAYWQGVQAKAIDEGDHKAAERAFEERKRLESERPQPVADPEVVAFTQKEWFRTDPLARQRAFEICEGLAKQGLGPADQLEQAERAIRKEFPEHFPTPVKKAAAVQTGQARNPNPSNRAKGFADMPEESRKMALDYESRLGVKREDFAKSFWAQESRRVG